MSLRVGARRRVRFGYTWKERYTWVWLLAICSQSCLYSSFDWHPQVVLRKKAHVTRNVGERSGEGPLQVYLVCWGDKHGVSYSSFPRNRAYMSPLVWHLQSCAWQKASRNRKYGTKRVLSGTPVFFAGYSPLAKRHDGTNFYFCRVLWRCQLTTRLPIT